MRLRPAPDGARPMCTGWNGTWNRWMPQLRRSVNSPRRGRRRRGSRFEHPSAALGETARPRDSSPRLEPIAGKWAIGLPVTPRLRKPEYDGPFKLALVQRISAQSHVGESCPPDHYPAGHGPSLLGANLKTVSMTDQHDRVQCFHCTGRSSGHLPRVGICRIGRCMKYYR